MGGTLTHLGECVAANSRRMEYDEAIKEILADKQIIAMILRDVTDEFYGMDVEDIVPYIEDPAIGRIPVNPGMTNNAVTGMPQESKVSGEGVVYYDVRFHARIPGMKGKARAYHIIVDMEAQRDPNPGYDLVTRGIFYAGRMLSDQMGRNVTGKNYDALEKVYSIWIVFNCNQEIANTISEYAIVHTVKHGSVPEKYAGRHDLCRVVVVRMPKEGALGTEENPPSGLHKFLYDVFVSKKQAADKLDTLRNTYHLKTETLERSVDVMCNLSLGLIEEGRVEGCEEGLVKGREEGRVEGLETGELIGKAKSVVRFAKKHNCTFEEAFDEVGFAEEERVEIFPFIAEAEKAM